MTTAHFGLLRRITATPMVALLAIAALATGPQIARARIGTAAACAALGSYAVGSATPPVAQRGAPPPPGSKVSPTYPPSPEGADGSLRGTINLTAYKGCGEPSAGNFVLRSALPPVRMPQAVGTPPAGTPKCRVGAAMPGVPTIVLSASGTFAQDPAHVGDPMYVLVQARVQYGRLIFSCIQACPNGGSASGAPCPPAGCAQASTLTRTVAFMDVTGYLRWQPSDPHHLGLVFLPPPDPAQTAAAALSIQPLGVEGVD
jgi:hypothetical protein